MQLFRFVGFFGLLVAGVAARGEEPVSFEREVAPLLESRCLRCHNAEKAEGGLSLATFDAARRGGEILPAVVPGKPEESYLLDMVAGDEPQMPRGGDPLSAEQVDALHRWIADGAPWPTGVTLVAKTVADGPWWSLEPLTRPALPDITNTDRIRTPIDAFILAKLAEKGLSLRPEADRRTLIRRLNFDLHGLPPTPEEIDAFLADDRPDAYEQLVNRLLASPRYGERWGRHWLDVVHYADTHGYDKDKRRDNAWPYRDYVIESFNRDKPYSRFVQEQVAGDELFPDVPEATIATGFVAAGPWDYVGHVELREGTVEKAKTRLIDRDDMLASTMSTFVSQTVHCARCHDHKFDPIPTRDYYRLQAVFAGVDRGDRPYADPSRAMRRADLGTTLERLKAQAREVRHEIENRRSPAVIALDADLARLREQRANLPGPPDNPPSPTNGYHSGIEPTPDMVKWVQVDLGRTVPIDEVRLIPARPVDFPDTPGFGFPARFRVEVSDDPDFPDPDSLANNTDIDVVNPGDDWWVIRSQGKAGRYVRVTATRLWPRRDDYVFALGELQVISGGENVASGAVVSALDSIEAGRWGARHLVDGHDSRRRLDRPEDTDISQRRADLLFALRETEAQRAGLAESQVPPDLRSRRDRLDTEITAVEAEIAALEPASQVYALVSQQPQPIHVLNRGDVTQPGEEIGPGALSCIEGIDADFTDTPNEGVRRADLARWLADPRNPLTWRSIVNRVWLYHFGRGIVDTPSDFGRNGSIPTHPELLDWLAVEFQDSGQSLKDLHRLICLSAVYRQTSAHDESAAAIDAGNQLLWRQNRRRLEAEEIRDSILSVAGTLDPRMGGPGFALFRFKDDHSPVYDHDDPAWIDPPDGRRRTVYRFVVRSVRNPFLECLDGADPNINVPVRNETITALQALALLNDPFLISQARAFANRLHRESLNIDEQIDAAYRLALGRPPRLEEREALATYAGVYGLENACRLLFNLNEFVFVD